MGSDLNPNYLSVFISFCEMKQSRGHVADLSISRQTACGSAFRCCTLAGGGQSEARGPEKVFMRLEGVIVLMREPRRTPNWTTDSGQYG